MVQLSVKSLVALVILATVVSARTYKLKARVDENDPDNCGSLSYPGEDCITDADCCYVDSKCDQGGCSCVNVAISLFTEKSNQTIISAFQEHFFWPLTAIVVLATAVNARTFKCQPRSDGNCELQGHSEPVGAYAADDGSRLTGSFMLLYVSIQFMRKNSAANTTTGIVRADYTGASL
ncbi:hypothetical protein BJV82DRAFT_655210 [Fennellomyces sp. T-0311]|nr:hypothetical protein BJV82DRAFT_655210 [Fennellomyces sp. T-0311]